MSTSDHRAIARSSDSRCSIYIHQLLYFISCLAVELDDLTTSNSSILIIIIYLLIHHISLMDNSFFGNTFSIILYFTRKLTVRIIH